MPVLPPYAIVLDDHPLVGQGMAHYLQATLPQMTVHAATSWTLVQHYLQLYGCPQVLVADVWLAESNSLTALEQWRNQCQATPWLAISGDDDPLMQEKVRNAGAQGFVQKQASPEIFGLAFKAVLSGGQWFESLSQINPYRSREKSVTPTELGLTTRQGEILSLVLRGLPNKRIALMLHLSESTVKEHLTGILEKLGVRTRVEAIIFLRGRELQVLRPVGSEFPGQSDKSNG